VVSTSDADTLLLREADPELTARLDEIGRSQADESSAVGGSLADDGPGARDLARDLSELRLVKDEYEIARCVRPSR
jgi:Xaa-Pro aminopeptidase